VNDQDGLPAEAGRVGDVGQDLGGEAAAHADRPGDPLWRREQQGQRDDPALGWIRRRRPARIRAERSHGLVDEAPARSQPARAWSADPRSVPGELDGVPAERERSSSIGERTLTTSSRGSSSGASPAIANSLLPTPWNRKRTGGRVALGLGSAGIVGRRTRVTSDGDVWRSSAMPR
jgi:hypothetical protein